MIGEEFVKIRHCKRDGQHEFELYEAPSKPSLGLKAGLLNKIFDFSTINMCTFFKDTVFQYGGSMSPRAASVELYPENDSAV